MADGGADECRMHPLNDRARIERMLMTCDQDDMLLYRDIMSRRLGASVKVETEGMTAFAYALRKCPDVRSVKYAMLVGWCIPEVFEEWMRDSDVGDDLIRSKAEIVMIYSAAWFNTFPESKTGRGMLEKCHVILADMSAKSRNGCALVDIFMKHLPDDFTVIPSKTRGRFRLGSVEYCWHCLQSIFRMPRVVNSELGPDLFDAVADAASVPLNSTMARHRKLLCQYSTWLVANSSSRSISVRTVIKAVMVRGDRDVAAALDARPMIKPSMRRMLECIITMNALNRFKLERKMARNMIRVGWKFNLDDLFAVSTASAPDIIRRYPKIVTPYEQHPDHVLKMLIATYPWKMIKYAIPAHRMDDPGVLCSWVGRDPHSVSKKRVSKIFRRGIMRGSMISCVASQKIIFSGESFSGGLAVMGGYIRRVWTAYINMAFSDSLGFCDHHVTGMIVNALVASCILD